MTDSPRTCAWPDAVARFAALVEEQESMRPMLSLARFLATSRYARSLFPSVTAGVLTLGRTPGPPSGQDELRIRFDPEFRQFRFTHLQRPGDPNPWSRECDPQEWQPVLERIFHKRLQWFHEG